MTLLKYIVKVPSGPGGPKLIDVLEMLRYSRDVVLEIKSTEPLTFVVGHEISGDRFKERLKFFREHILGRWKQFGFEIELTEDTEFLFQTAEENYP